MRRRLAAIGAACIATAGAVAAVATAATSTGPKAANGRKVQLVATGVNTPTSFAFGAGKVFEGDAGNFQTNAPGGVFVLKKGVPVRLAGSPGVVFGLVWHKNTLYIASGPKLLAWSGWNGVTFTKQRTIYTGPNGFPGFNGLAFGPDGRLYAGVDVGETNDHGPATAPYQYDILSFKPRGKDLKVFARGMRQPWQLAFPAGSSSPLVSDLGQDAGAQNPPDFVLKVHKGDNYGFPKCNWLDASKCKGYKRPFKFFPSHSDVGGVAIIGKRLYLSEFGMGGRPAQVVAMPTAGGAVKSFVTGFSAPVIGLGATGNWLYFGTLAVPNQPGKVLRVLAPGSSSSGPGFTG